MTKESDKRLITQVENCLTAEIIAIEWQMKAMRELQESEEISTFDGKVINKKLNEMFERAISKVRSCHLVSEKNNWGHYTSFNINIGSNTFQKVRNERGDMDVIYPQYFRKVEFFRTDEKRFSFKDFKIQLEIKFNELFEDMVRYKGQFQNVEVNLAIHNQLAEKLEKMRTDAGPIFRNIVPKGVY